jgi:hypothetical protein
MPATEQGKAWEWEHSIWMLWTLTILFGWVGFLYIGVRTRTRKWIVMGAIFSLTLIIPVVDAALNPTEHISTVWEILYGVVLAIALLCLVMAVVARKEYLMRLDAVLSDEPYEDDNERRRIYAEYGLEPPAKPPEEKPGSDERAGSPPTGNKNGPGRVVDE